MSSPVDGKHKKTAFTQSAACHNFEGMAQQDLPINSSEEFVLSVCRRTFLSLWCYNNPRAKLGKELCDILVVCEPQVIIISVKNVRLREGEPTVEHDRWERKAIDDSVKQIYGAERWLHSATQVIRGDGSLGLNLPPLVQRKIQRIAVAFGGRGVVAVKSGDFGKGFVHVMSEHSFLEVLAELDTIAYLGAKEAFTARCSVVVEGSESNLLGWYLYNNRSFPGGADLMVVDNTVWQEIREKPEFKRRKEADRESYVWDRLIEELSDPKAKPVSGPGPTLADLELALRTMAREPRLARRMLGRGLCEFIKQAKAGKLRSRILVAPGGTIYVLVCFRADTDPGFWEAELACRCLIARHIVGHGDTIIAVGLSEFVPGIGSGSTLVYMHLPAWSASDDEKAAVMKAEYGFFMGADFQHRHDDEYPASD